MAYTDKQKLEMYESIHEDLSGIAVKLQDFIESETGESEEKVSARTMNNQIVGMVGNISIRIKRSKVQE